MAAVTQEPPPLLPAEAADGEPGAAEAGKTRQLRGPEAGGLGHEDASNEENTGGLTHRRRKILVAEERGRGEAAAAAARPLAPLKLKQWRNSLAIGSKVRIKCTPQPRGKGGHKEEAKKKKAAALRDMQRRRLGLSQAPPTLALMGMPAPAGGMPRCGEFSAAAARGKQSSSGLMATAKSGSTGRL